MGGRTLMVAIGLALVLPAPGVAAMAASDPLEHVDATTAVNPRDGGLVFGAAVFRAFPAGKNATIGMRIPNREPKGRYAWDIHGGSRADQGSRASFGNPGTRRSLTTDSWGGATVTMMLARGSNVVVEGGYSLNIYAKGVQADTGPVIARGDIEPVYRP